MLDGLLDGLTTNQLKDLRHRLNQTDDSTTVLIPVGPKAFRLATLRLNKLYWSNQKETSVSKAEALQTLQDAISQRLPKKEAANESDSDAEDVAGDGAPKPSSTEKMMSSSSSIPSKLLPFIDIREEVDDDGKPIRTEAIDVTDHLQHLVEKQQQQPQQNAGSSAPGGPMDENEQQDETDISKDSGPRPMDNSEFEKLTARLDELALLEEAGADYVPQARFHQRTKQVTSAASSSSSSPRKKAAQGWSKGFLNKKPGKTKPPAKSSPSVVSATKPSTGGATKNVSFGMDQVHEIPQEGHQRPVPDQSLRQSRPIEPDLFTGVVQERPRRKPSSGTPAKEKHLSRFALERQQGLR
jgi:hypothetical protein